MLPTSTSVSTISSSVSPGDAIRFAICSVSAWDRHARRRLRLAFPDAETLADEMRGFGFENVVFERLTLGIVAIHVARKPMLAA